MEVNARPGKPAVVVVGLPGTAVKESRDRVMTAAGESNPLFPSSLHRSHDRLFSSLENIRIRPFKGKDYGTMAATAAAALLHHSAPRVRNPDFTNVQVTAHVLAERYGFTPPKDGDVARAAEHPKKYWRQLPRVAHRLAVDIFQNLRPQAQHPRHVYGVDYSFNIHAALAHAT